MIMIFMSSPLERKQKGSERRGSQRRGQGRCRAEAERKVATTGCECAKEATVEGQRRSAADAQVTQVAQVARVARVAKGRRPPHLIPKKYMTGIFISGESTNLPRRTNPASAGSHDTTPFK